ncbi:MULTISPECIES: MEDS domain-containing protein [Microbacterium]|uniref:MEDS domain-containing protein n=1 Tax=Microbacterium wangchenii TaxID=2541726 RepID=A0ABX5SYT7_9MICO|nr:MULTISPECIES: MEDS domain-containing protein [Microbacterium]MCK6068418.1 MEDS domain-containing protein [Microbacterium sp. EYE_512]QBR89979.1 hypothetical protein E4K62_15555 [Microbacterium wangchenii]
MNTPPSGDAPPVTFAGGVLDRYRHVCAFINSEDEESVVLDPFLAQSVEADDRLLFLVDATRAGEPIRRLRHLGFDTADLLARHRCEVRTWAETYLRGGRFDQQATLELLRRLLAGTPSPPVRMWADMGWAVGRPDIAESLIEFEAKANFIHAHHRNVVICTYDTAKFDGAFIVDILRTHPMVLLAGVLQENPYFVAPSEFLQERGARADR